MKKRLLGISVLSMIFAVLLMVGVGTGLFASPAPPTDHSGATLSQTQMVDDDDATEMGKDLHADFDDDQIEYESDLDEEHED